MVSKCLLRRRFCLEFIVFTLLIQTDDIIIPGPTVQLIRLDRIDLVGNVSVQPVCPLGLFVTRVVSDAGTLRCGGYELHGVDTRAHEMTRQWNDAESTRLQQLRLAYCTTAMLRSAADVYRVDHRDRSFAPPGKIVPPRTSVPRKSPSRTSTSGYTVSQKKQHTKLFT